jgi:hypothetical protein
VTVPRKTQWVSQPGTAGLDEACRRTTVPSPIYPDREGQMGLPSQLALFLSVLLAILALLVRYADVVIPVVGAHSFETLLVAFLTLLAGNIWMMLP